MLLAGIGRALLVGLVAVGVAAPARASAAQQPGQFDQQFIDMMVPHHQSAVEMATIAVDRAERPEIRDLAASIIQSQAEEIGRMQAWRQDWYGSEVTPPMSQMPMIAAMPGMAMEAMMNMEEEVARLRNAPAPFDQAFIDAMIPHHQSAIEAARTAEQQAAHPEVRELARAIIADQQREIDQLRQWRQAWYGSAEPAGAPAMPGMGDMGR